MELHQLRYFVELGRTLNYTTAAEKCYISRQALRQSVQSLEKEYRVRLINNERNHLSLTPAGKLLLENARKVLNAEEKLDAEMRSFVLHSHPIRIGISISVAPFYAPELLSEIDKLGAAFPAMQFEHLYRDADTLLDMLAAGDLEAALLVDLACLNEGFHRTVLRRDRLGIMLSDAHPLAKKTQLLLEDLEGQTLQLMSTPDRCFRPLKEKLTEQGIKAELRVVPDSYESFRAVRKEGALCIDRIGFGDPDRLSSGLEVDMPISNFKEELQLALLLPESPPRELLMIAEYLSEKCCKTTASMNIS